MPRGGQRPRSNTASLVDPSGHDSRGKSPVKSSLLSRSIGSWKLGRRRTATWSSNNDPTAVDDAEEGLTRQQLVCANPKFSSGSGAERVQPVKPVSIPRRHTFVDRSSRRAVSTSGRHRRRVQDETSPTQVPAKLLEQSEKELHQAMEAAQSQVDAGRLNGVVVEELSQVLAICKARGLMRHDCDVYDDACTMKSRLRSTLRNKLRQQQANQTKSN
jgi:hypothetical protein